MPLKKILTLLLLSQCLSGCGSSEEENTSATPVIPSVPQITITSVPQNTIASAYLRDRDGGVGTIGGEVIIEQSSVIESPTDKTESLWLFWVDEQKNKIGDAFLKTANSDVYTINIPVATLVPVNAKAIDVVPHNSIGSSIDSTLIKFHDFTGNTALSGPGGNEKHTWYYGEDRGHIYINRLNTQGGICVFDNGLVSVIDMENTQGAWELLPSGKGANQADDHVYPAFEYLCSENPINLHKKIADEYGVWTYSTINDAMYYGTLVYDTFLKYLGEPPLNEKIRLRVHYDYQYKTKVFWDGAYANFSDAFPFQYSTASLDTIAHEIAHGVLNRISNVDFFNEELSDDAKTIHEAFADISGVMAKYALVNNLDEIWAHGQETAYEGVYYTQRFLNQIETEYGAIESFLDYENAGANYYQRIGMFSYPFYLLTQKWGLEQTYHIYLNAARSCWTPSMTLTEGAQCIKQQAHEAELAENDVVDAFKAVKIKLFDEGILSHFFVTVAGQQINLSDNSQSTSVASEWLWDFGDGEQSTLQNPTHNYNVPGEYTITLTVSDTLGHIDSFYRTVTVAL